MTDEDGMAQDARDDGPARHRRALEQRGPGSAWLVTQKVLLPEPVSGYVERPALERRCGLADMRLTALLAPGGFGKTALLARCCRRLRKRGVAVAWLGVDEHDRPGALATYLALAFEQAGVAAFGRARGIEDAHAANGPDAAADSRGAYRMRLLLRAIERHGAPCLLALDEVERLGSDAVAVLNVLLTRAPPNLHFAMAARERPPGLDIAMFLLEGTGTIVTADELRFSRREIAAFLGGRLPRREFNDVVESTAGWPIALRLYHNGREAEDPGRTRGDTIAAWIEARLWRGLADADRDLLLDMALFDWFDGPLLAEATGTPDAERRIAAMRSLTGLLQTTGGDGPTMRLHPLIRDYCAEWRTREDPARARRIHAGIAEALAHRIQVVDALRHAALAGDVRLAGEIGERAGGVRIGPRHGFENLQAVVGRLPAAVFAAHPRMALARCLVFAVRGELARAERAYRTIAAATADFTRDRDGGDDAALGLDHLVLQGTLYSTGCKPAGMQDGALIEQSTGAAASKDTHVELRALFNYGLSVACEHVADLDRAVEYAERAHVLVNAKSHLAPHVGYALGALAMCQGYPKAAMTHYDRALALARSAWLRDSGGVVIGEALKLELAWELRGPADHARPRRVSLRLLGESGASAGVFAATVATGMELELANGPPDRALALVEEARAYARRTQRPVLLRLLNVLQVAGILADGRSGDAARAWRVNDLPADPADCLDPGRSGWRLMETLALTQVRLCVARGAIDEARTLARGLRETAAARGLVRTLVRAEAASMVLEHADGADEAAAGHLRALATLHERTGYAGALLGARDVALAVLPQLDRSGSNGAMNALSGVLAGPERTDRSGAPLALSEAELDVLSYLARRWHDKQIAVELHLTVDGVRYRIRRIFAKLDARNREDAVRRACAKGLLPMDAAGVPEN